MGTDSFDIPKTDGIDVKIMLTDHKEETTLHHQLILTEDDLARQSAKQLANFSVTMGFEELYARWRQETRDLTDDD